MTADEYNARIKELNATNDSLRTTINELNSVIAQCKTKVEHLTAAISQLTEDSKGQKLLIEQQILMIEALNKTITELKERIARLEEQKNKNSRNSSKPPSSDGLSKPPASNRRPSGNKPGAQNGHPGSSLQLDMKPNKFIDHKPSACEGCLLWDKCKGTACVAESRSVVDISVEILITAHNALELACCKLNGEHIRGDFPENIKATIQYGGNLQALATSLNTVGAVSINRTHEILQGVFNIPISTGTVRNIVHRAAEAVTPAYDEIRLEITEADLLHFDETGTRMEGKIAWVHDASNSEYTYLDISRKRGKEGMDQCGVLPNYDGIAVHDCWKSYWKYPDLEAHAVCCAHILRELIGVYENDPGQIWAKSMEKLLLKMKRARENAIAAGKEKLSDSYLQQFSSQYDRLIRIGKFQNPLPESAGSKNGRPKKGKIRALIERMETLKGSVCLFVRDFKVPFDNNQAERDLRMVKTKTKVSGCFRSEEGAKDYLKIMSYVGTAHKRGLNAYDAIRKALSGNPRCIFQEGF